jgi:hypothetical protein
MSNENKYMNKKSLIILLLLFFHQYIFCQDYSNVNDKKDNNWFCCDNFNGVFFKYESSFTTNILLKQEVRDYDFVETENADLVSFPTLKLGYSRTGFDYSIPSFKFPGLFYDLGLGIVYSKSRMNAVDSLDWVNIPSLFISGVPNNETFFDYYQTGNLASINDFGLNFQADFGTFLFVGLEIDAGLSRLKFTDSKVDSQKVKSLGWFASPKARLGLAISNHFWEGEDNEEDRSNWGGLFKIYATYGSSFRTNTMDWVSEDKKLKNFSKISSKGNPIGLGASLTFYF